MYLHTIYDRLPLLVSKCAQDKAYNTSGKYTHTVFSTYTYANVYIISVSISIYIYMYDVGTYIIIFIMCIYVVYIYGTPQEDYIYKL